MQAAKEKMVAGMGGISWEEIGWEAWKLESWEASRSGAIKKRYTVQGEREKGWEAMKLGSQEVHTGLTAITLFLLPSIFSLLTVF